MFCKACGNKIDNDSVFCSYCGIKQSDSNKPSKDTFFPKQDARNLNEDLSFGKPRQSNSNVNLNMPVRPKYDVSYEKESGATVFGIVLIVISFILVLLGPFQFEDETSYTQFIGFGFLVTLVLRIVVVSLVVGIAKRQNRDKIAWSVFAFFLPSIALIVIGLLNKLYNPDEKQITSTNLVEDQTKTSIDFENIEIPGVTSIDGDKIIFADGTRVEVIKDIQGKYFIVSNISRHYYKTQEAATRAAYIYKITGKISKKDIGS